MVALYENGIIPHIQIHDEVDISVESPEKAEEIIRNNGICSRVKSSKQSGL